MKRRDIIEAILFIPAMALLAVVIFGGMYLIIVGGAWILRAWYWVLTILIPLPHPLALALAAMAAACTVYGCVQLLVNGRRRLRGKVSLKA